jgi:hypothetical protein
MAQAWELRMHERWRTRALLGFGLSGLVLNSLLLWLAYATLTAGALLARDPLETLYLSFTLAAAIGIVFATLRGRFETEPGVEGTGVRARPLVLQLVGFAMPFLPIVALGGLLLRFLSTGPR